MCPLHPQKTNLKKLICTQLETFEVGHGVLFMHACTQLRLSVSAAKASLSLCVCFFAIRHWLFDLTNTLSRFTGIEQLFALWVQSFLGFRSVRGQFLQDPTWAALTPRGEDHLFCPSVLLNSKVHSYQGCKFG
jgi:hypothetical protein